MRIIKIIKNNKGASLIETLMAMAFIAMTFGALINLTVSAIRLSLKNQVLNELTQRANLITEEIVKDFTLTDIIRSSEVYCSIPEVSEFINKYAENVETPCNIVEQDEGYYTVNLNITLYGKSLEITRDVILQ